MATFPGQNLETTYFVNRRYYVRAPLEEVISGWDDVIICAHVRVWLKNPDEIAGEH